LLLAAAVQSFAHMPLGISDCNTSNIPFMIKRDVLVCKQSTQ